MMPQAKTTVKKYWFLYLLSIGILAALKYAGRITDSNALTWILTPTTRWVSILCNIPFEYLPHEGYVNHVHQFLIAPSCSGIRFMMITFLMLVFSFLYQMNDTRVGYLWFFLSAAFSYTSTIFVNGIRIAVSIYLPSLLEDLGLMKGWLTPDRLHTLIGTVIYFSSLCIIYPLAASIFRHAFLPTSKELTELPSAPFLKLYIPTFWYLLFVLALPFVVRIYRKDWEGFGQYALLILCVCFSVTTLLRLMRLFKNNLYSG